MKKVIIVNIVAMVVAVLLPMAASAAAYTPIYIDNSSFTSRDDFYNSDSPYVEIFGEFKNIVANLEQNNVISYSYDMDKSKCCFYWGQAEAYGDSGYNQLLCYYLDNDGKLKKVIYHLKPYVIDDVRYIDDESKNHATITENYNGTYSDNGYNGMVYHDQDNNKFFSYYSIGRANCPVFSTEEACLNYLVNGVYDNALYVPDSLKKTEAPIDLTVYADKLSYAAHQYSFLIGGDPKRVSDDSTFLYVLEWMQTQDLYSHLEVIVKGWYREDETLADWLGSIISTGYAGAMTSLDKRYTYDLKSKAGRNFLAFYLDDYIPRDYIYGKDETSSSWSVEFRMYNTSEYGASDISSVIIEGGGAGQITIKKGEDNKKIDNRGIDDDDDYKSYVEENKIYDSDNFHGVSDNSDSLLNYISSGFGLLGDNGLIALLKAVLSFVPSWFWSIMAAGVSMTVLVGIIKLIL